jgi:hypothetical protein
VHVAAPPLAVVGGDSLVPYGAAPFGIIR